MSLSADYVVLATGSSYPFPAKVAQHGPADFGELRGELTAAASVLPGDFPDEFRRQLREQLDEMGIELRLGVPSGSFGADLTIACHGSAVDTGYLDGAGGRIEVTPELRVRGSGTLFAVGDVTALPELQMARLAQMHGEVVAGGRAEQTYAPHPDAIVLPLGPSRRTRRSPTPSCCRSGRRAASRTRRTPGCWAPRRPPRSRTGSIWTCIGSCSGLWTPDLPASMVSESADISKRFDEGHAGRILHTR